jgi:FAD/FMN-containing dehydrogenase
MSVTGLVEPLLDIVGADGVLTGEDVQGRSAGIWRSDCIAAQVLVRPRTTEEVSRILSLCNQAGQRVVAQGGLTGLVESALTQPDDLVLSLERMNQIEAIDPVNRSVTVEAGAVLQAVQEAVAEHDLMYPLDLGGRGSCTIGGNISTNAGGNRVIRYGMTRESVLGLEAVLADGTIVSSMNQMIKNNAGYDLKQLFIGSEGTLGVVTRAVLRLREKPGTQATVLVSVQSFANLSLLLKKVDAALGGTLSAFEVMWNAFYRIVTTPPARSTPPLPQDAPYYVLIEAMGCDQQVVEQALLDAYDGGLVSDIAVASSEAQRLQMWAMRDDVEQCLRHDPSYIFDVSLPIPAMEGYVDQVNKLLDAEFSSFQNFTFGHLGDGNLHFVISASDTASDTTPAETRRRIEGAVYRPLRVVGGSVSAEHGVGLEKKPWLDISRNQNEVKLMKTLKAALDPVGILNPGKIF